MNGSQVAGETDPVKQTPITSARGGCIPSTLAHPASAGKQRSYEKESRLSWHTRVSADPPLEIVRIPFEEKNHRLPPPCRKCERARATLLAVNGLDSRKEDLSESFERNLPFGIGFLPWMAGHRRIRSKSVKMRSACFRAARLHCHPARDR